MKAKAKEIIAIIWELIGIISIFLLLVMPNQKALSCF